MRIGVLLPTFDTTAAPALAAAADAEESGVHGVFVFDHLWQLGTEGAPSLAPFPVLGAIAASTSRVSLGTLVARVGLLPDALLVDSFVSLDRLSGGRVIAALGTGDDKSKPEHDALGLQYAPADERRASLARCAEALLDRGVTTWIGGGSAATNAVARRLGVPVNLWAARPERLAAEATVSRVTWGGVLPEGDRGAERLSALAAAGAEWAVFSWVGECRRLVDAARSAGVDLEG